MRFIIVLLVSTVFALKTFAQDKKEIVVAFYNFENLFDTLDDPTIDDQDFLPDGAYAYTSKIYNEKLAKLEEVVSKFGVEANPDGFAILGIAEIENENVVLDVMNQPKLKNRNIKVVHFNSPDVRGIDVALAYNPKYFKVLGAKALPLVLAPDGGFKEKTRDVLWVTGKLNGELVHVFVNHWPSRRGGEAATAPKRKAAAAICKRIYDSLYAADPNVKTIIMGDLNDDPINESITKVLNATGKMNEAKNGKMYNPFLKYYQEGLGTMAYQDAWGLFDQIILSGSWTSKTTSGLHFDRARVFNEAFLIEKFGQYKGYPKRSFSGNIWNEGYSDHFPTMIYLK